MSFIGGWSNWHHSASTKLPLPPTDLTLGFCPNWSANGTLDGWGKMASTSPDRIELTSVGWSSRGTNVTWSSHVCWPQYFVLRTSTAWSWDQDLTIQGPPENESELFISLLRSGLSEPFSLGKAAFSRMKPVAPPNRSGQST